MYRVYSETGKKPVGAFEIELRDIATISYLTFDIVTLPSDPGIRVFASDNDITYTEASSVSRNGYRVNAWFPTRQVKFLRIEIAPTTPTTSAASTYTFGLTDFSATTMDFHLYSELNFRPVAIAPITAQVRFRADNPDLAYFLTFGSGRPFRVEPDQTIDLPGVTAVLQNTHINTQWRAVSGGLRTDITLPAGVYPSTLGIIDTAESRAVRVVYGMTAKSHTY